MQYVLYVWILSCNIMFIRLTHVITGSIVIHNYCCVKFLTNHQQGHLWTPVYLPIPASLLLDFIFYYILCHSLSSTALVSLLSAEHTRSEPICTSDLSAWYTFLPNNCIVPSFTSFKCAQCHLLKEVYLGNVI
ncbi:hypothetical protein HJG60_008240 [Phyllostomus discolor]|uniref:Uncharacterized protein n=1 Tax=Phyllostomus discolor TaxID=89673 RepID=A0A833ZB23_9CHIR|nr:hypothetical protein HJG60_008240 [Phyllostomus discolor]